MQEIDEQELDKIIKINQDFIDGKITKKEFNDLMRPYKDNKRRRGFSKRAVALIVAIVVAVGILVVPRFVTEKIGKNYLAPVQLPAFGAEEKTIGDCSVTIKKKRLYLIEGVVVSTYTYIPDSVMNALSPMDVGIGWGWVGDNYELLSFTHDGNRNLRWTVGSDLPKKYMIAGSAITHVSNTHVIPENDEVRAKLFAIQTGSKVLLKGYLVKATWSEEYSGGVNYHYWNSSTLRFDTGENACEVMLVTDVIFIA